MKKGQVSWFILIGVVILIFTAFLLWVSGETKGSVVEKGEVTSQETAFSVAPVKNYVQGCLKQATEDATILVSGQGGYFVTPEPYHEFTFFRIPYYFNQQLLSPPTHEEVEKEMSDAIKQGMNLCLSNFEGLPENLAWNEDFVPTVKITEKVVLTSLDLSLHASNGDVVQQFDALTFSHRSPFGRALAVRDDIIREQMNVPNSVRMSKLTALATQQDFFIDLDHVDNTVIYKLKFVDGQESGRENNQETYVFAFAVQYDWSDHEI
jgi:hypothetical protein